MGSPSGQVLAGAATVVEGEGAIDVAVVVLAVVPVGACGLQATITRPKIVTDLRRSMGWTDRIQVTNAVGAGRYKEFLQTDINPLTK
jgi:hypothetical protein